MVSYGCLNEWHSIVVQQHFIAIRVTMLHTYTLSCCLTGLLLGQSNANS